MNFKEICDLIELVASKNIPLVEVEHSGVRVKIQGSQGQVTVAGAVPLTAAPVQVERSPEAEEEGLSIIRAPMVGTFYRAPSPGADPFVEEGAKVKEGTVLCIIEAMKLMNEIESDAKGEIVTIYAENGESVEFGQKLFALKCD